ncbi:MAG: hypothetical protein AUK47_24895 [Deltaproteobacteria bacterium CG2_30_63_29]|nr:MAG: hypothetical protein AUK47_24895 [Deltaproteobacteria bacterium CG2_30_63_29]
MALRRGGRVFIRYPTQKDSDAFLDVVHSSRTFYAGLVDPPASAEAFAAYLGRSCGDEFCSILVLRTADETLLGVYELGALAEDGGVLQASITCYVSAAYAGRGYMGEALRLVLDFAFADLGLGRLVADVPEGNEQTEALVHACGFRRKGTGVNTYGDRRWAMSRADWGRLVEAP